MIPTKQMRFLARLCAVALLCCGTLVAKSKSAEELFNALNMQVWLDSTTNQLKEAQHKAQSSSCLSEASKKVFKSEMTGAIKTIQKDGKSSLLQALDSRPYKSELLDALETPIGKRLSNALASKNMSIFSCRFQYFDQYESFWSDEFSLQDMRAFADILLSKAPAFAQEYGLFVSRVFEKLESKELDSISSELARCGIDFEEYYCR